MDSSVLPAAYIRTDADLAALADALGREPLLAIDTESNSLYAYRERVCLVQLSTRSADYIIDPLAIADMSPLAPLLADPAIKKVFHAAEYDLICMKRDFGFTVANLFDTMIAARICGHKLVGLGNLLHEFVGIEVDKSHQRDNWGKRPLPPDSLSYAQLDTHYLPLLHDRLSDELTALGCWHEANESFVEACDVIVPELAFDPEGYWKIGIPNQLGRREMAVLRELYLMRDQIAREHDTPPFKIMGDKTLVHLSQIMPRRASDLYGIEGMSAGQIRRYSKPIVRAVERGESAKLPEPPSRQPPTDPEIVDCYTLLREWRKTRAQERGVESDVILSREALWSLAHRKPKTMDEMREVQGLGPWRMEAYGQELLVVLQKCRAKGE